LSGVEPALARALADELDALGIIVSDLAEDLAGDPETVRRHMTSLQSVDRLSQTQRAIAELLRADGPLAERLAAVRLDSLSTALHARLLDYQTTPNPSRMLNGRSGVT